MGHINSVKVNNKIPDEDVDIFDNSVEDDIEIPENDSDLFSLIEKESSEFSSIPEEETDWSSNFDNGQYSAAFRVTLSKNLCILAPEIIVNSPQTKLIFFQDSVILSFAL